MKFLKLILLATLLFAGCEDAATIIKQAEEAKAEQKQEPAKADPPVTEAPKQELKLAWGDKPEWTKALSEAVDKAELSSDIVNPCKTVSVKQCLKLALAKMADPESGFDPNQKFEECSKKKETYKNPKHFPDRKDGRVWCMVDTEGIVASMGLLQISKESANGYGCGITKAAQLYKPDTNLECAVKIAERWLNRDKVFFGKTVVDGKTKWLGLGRYWSVARSASDSNKQVLSYLNKY